MPELDVMTKEERERQYAEQRIRKQRLTSARSILNELPEHNAEARVNSAGVVYVCSRNSRLSDGMLLLISEYLDEIREVLEEK